MNIHAFLNQAADVAVQVTQHDPLSLPANLLDRVKLTALIDTLNALDYALLHSEEAKMLDQPEDREYLRDVSYEYAKDQVKIQMNINALKVNLQEVAA
jgi:hypothetical protein